MLMKNENTAGQPDQNMVTEFFEKMQLSGLIKDHEGKYSFIFDDNIEVDILLERRYLFFETLIATLPKKVMTKDRLLSDLAKHTLFDMKEHEVCFYIDNTTNSVNGYLRVPVDGINETEFESSLGNFINVAETYKNLMDKILRMGELSDIPIEFRTD